MVARKARRLSWAEAHQSLRKVWHCTAKQGMEVEVLCTVHCGVELLAMRRPVLAMALQAGDVQRCSVKMVETILLSQGEVLNWLFTDKAPTHMWLGLGLGS